MSKIKVKCNNCGKIIEKWPFEIEKHNHYFCDRTCRGEWLRKRPKEKTPNYRGGNIKVLCDNCGKEIEKVPAVAKNNSHNFCNRKCRGQWQSEHKKGKDNPKWKGGRKEIICEICEKVIKRKLHEIKRSKHYFCSVKCQAKWRSTHQRGANNSHWKGGEINQICSICGKGFWISQ